MLKIALFSTEYLIDRYNEKIRNVENAGVKKSITSGVCVGVYHFFVHCCFAITFW